MTGIYSGNKPIVDVTSYTYHGAPLQVGDSVWSSDGSYVIHVVGASPPVGAAVSTVTGVSPIETSYSLYGHIIPLSVFGVGRIGGEIIAGPWIENGNASFIISFGVPADPSGTRTLREIAFDSEVVWTAADGFASEAFTYRFYGGTLTQAADALETTHFGANAVAYRPQILIAFENLPLANTKFRKIPYVAAVIADSTGDDVNLGEAFERLAYSPFVGYTSAQFDTSGITDGLVSGGLIYAEQTTFLDAIQQFGRFYPWDILQTDKLRIVDRGSNVTADVTLDKSSLMNQVVIARDEPNSVPSILELSTIDPDADYTIVPSRAQRPRAPVAVTTSVQTESAYLPAIMESSTRTAIVTYTKYREEQARKRVSFTAMAYGLELEPGDLVKLSDLGVDFNDETFKVLETLHGANYSVEITAEAILKCLTGTSTDPHIANVVLLLGFTGADGATGAPGMTDESPAMHGTATVYGNAQIDTALSKFGGASLLTDGNGDGISFPDSNDWVLSASNSDQFTVEAWVRPASTTETDKIIVGQHHNVGFLSWYFGTNSSSQLQFLGSTNASSYDWTPCISAGLTWTSGQWYHVAADKDAVGKLRIYRDGVMLASCTPSNSSLVDVAATVTVGCDGAFQAPFTDGRSWNGSLDEVRVTKGLARYASDSGYTVPTAAFPRV